MISYYGFVKLLQQQQQKTQDVEMTSSSYATRHLKIKIPGSFKIMVQVKSLWLQKRSTGPVNKEN